MGNLTLWWSAEVNAPDLVRLLMRTVKKMVVSKTKRKF